MPGFLIPYGVIALLVASLLSGITGYRMGQDHEQAKAKVAIEQAISERDKAQADANTISVGYQQVVAYQQSLQKKTERKWREALNNPVYRDCKPDAVGLRLLNDEFAASNAARRSDPTMPGIKPAPPGRDDGRPDAGTSGLGSRLLRLFSSSRQADPVQREGQ